MVAFGEIGRSGRACKAIGNEDKFHEAQSFLKQYYHEIGAQKPYNERLQTAWCEQHAIAYEEVSVGTIKRHVTGKGNASKDVMLDAARHRGHQPIDDNEADALALLYWAMEYRQGGL